MKLVAWLSGVLATMDPAAVPVDHAKPPVVVVHGIDGSSRDMARLVRALQADGREVFAPSLRPNDGSVTIEALSEQLADYIEANVQRRPFDLVGYSMGGIVSRHYLQRRDGMKHVRKFVTLCSPHHGTITAAFRNKPGAQQMRRRSVFLRDLNADAGSLRKVGFTSLWTPTDLIILPAHSSEVAGANNVRMWGIGHVTFILEKRGIRKVIEVLE
jgi:triacylglycerol lipase